MKILSSLYIFVKCHALVISYPSTPITPPSSSIWRRTSRFRDLYRIYGLMIEYSRVFRLDKNQLWTGVKFTLVTISFDRRESSIPQLFTRFRIQNGFQVRSPSFLLRNILPLNFAEVSIYDGVYDTASPCTFEQSESQS